MNRTNERILEGLGAAKWYEQLANAIILQAISDYKAPPIDHGRIRHDDMIESARDEIERFIRSDWFGILTSLDPEYLIRLLREETHGH